MESTGPNPKFQKLAKQLLAIENRAAEIAELETSSGFVVTEKLRVSLSKLTGDNGYRSLMNRSLSLAKTDSSVVEPLRTRPDGSIEGLDTLEEELREGASTQVIARFLSLLAALIGDSLTCRLMKDVWPDADCTSEGRDPEVLGIIGSSGESR